MTGPNDFLSRQSEMIDRIGWSVTLVHPTEDDPDGGGPFAYTVGLTAHDHPELIIAGLDPATAQALLNDLALRVYDRAERFTHGQHIDDLIAGDDAVIVDGAPPTPLWPGAAVDRYGTDRVRLQQVVWPDADGRLPWQEGYAYTPGLQPLIGGPISRSTAPSSSLGTESRTAPRSRPRALEHQRSLGLPASYR